MRLEPIKKTPAEQQAADAIRRFILTGGLKPNTRITEAAMAEKLALSRGTIRAALHQLSLEGLIIQVPYTGWTVMPLTARDAWELYTLRASLESLAAGLATDNLDDPGRKRLTEAYNRLLSACEKCNHSLVAEADFKLHMEIVAASKHQRLIEQYRIIAQQIRTYIVSSDSTAQDFQICVDHHQPIVEAILDGRKDDAERLSAEHNLLDGKRLVAQLERTDALHR